MTGVESRHWPSRKKEGLIFYYYLACIKKATTSKRKLYSIFLLVPVGYPRLCNDILGSMAASFRTSASPLPFKAKIDPDGWGRVHPFYVTCKWSSDQTHMLTVVHHNKEKRSRVQGIANNPPASYRAPLVYEGATLRQLAALVDASKSCKQFIKYECFHSLLHSYGTDYAYWLNRAHQKMSHWGGARPGQNQTCACYNTSPRSCADQRYKCNCDKNDDTWRVDEGDLTDKENLPIAEVRFGDVGQVWNNREEEGHHTIGPLICTN